MNIIKIQDMLKGAPDQALVGYVQNPSGQVPTYLALSELQRRKEMRNTYQANKPEEKSVAEDLVQESQPQPQPGVMGLPAGQPMQQAMQPPPEMPVAQMAQGGLAELDVGDMYNENNYANGGIVAFAGKDGSEVKADTPASRVDTMYKLLSGAPYKLLRSLTEASANVPYEAAQSQFSGLPEDIFHKNVFGGEPGGTASTAQQYPSGDKIPGATVVPPVDPNAKPAADAKPAPVAEVDPFASIKKQLAAPSAEKARSLQDYAADYKAALGEDPTLQSAKNRIAKMEAKADEDEKSAGWMALAKAGLTMAAGKSPHALQNIAEGATAGVNDYSSAKERMQKLREKHFELQSQLDRQARAEHISAVTFGANSKEHSEDRAAREKLEKMSLGNQLAIAQLNYGLNIQNKSVANRDKAIDNAMAKAKIIAEQKGISDANDFDAIYQPILMQEMATLGVTSGTGSTYKPPVGGTLQTAKNGVLNYVRNAAK
jgi:hypothetical protein